MRGVDGTLFLSIFGKQKSRPKSFKAACGCLKIVFGRDEPSGTSCSRRPSNLFPIDTARAVGKSFWVFPAGCVRTPYLSQGNPKATLRLGTDVSNVFMHSDKIVALSFFRAIYMKIIDLTHPFTNTMPTYPGDAPPSLRQVASIGKEGYTDHRLETTMHMGTHIDAPAHMIEGGKRIDELPLRLFCGKGLALNARGRKKLDVELLTTEPFSNATILSGRIVFFCTGFSKKYREASYFTDYPVMTETLAQELVKRKIKMVGFDTPSPDYAPYAVHRILLGAGIPIIENLTNLEALLELHTFDIEALPMNISADAAFARIAAIIK